MGYIVRALFAEKLFKPSQQYSIIGNLTRQTHNRVSLFLLLYIPLYNISYLLHILFYLWRNVDIVRRSSYIPNLRGIM